MNKDRICDDRPIEPSEEIKKMSEEELEWEFQKRSGDICKEEKIVIFFDDTEKDNSKYIG